MTLKSDLLILLAAVIWGLAFVAQVKGMDHVGPFTYAGVRFALGALVLLPLALRRRPGVVAHPIRPRLFWLGGGLAGVVLFVAASLQQVGLQHTTPGHAGFITGLYVVIVPILGLCLGQRTNLGTWVGAALASVGLYLLCITGRLTMSRGDLLELAGAFFWAIHVLVIGWATLRFVVRRKPLVERVLPGAPTDRGEGYLPMWLESQRRKPIDQVLAEQGFR